LLTTTLDRAGENPDPKAEDEQIEEHLKRRHKPRRLTGGGDIPEPDRAEDRDRQVQGVGASQWLLAEVRRVVQRHEVVRGGEQEQEEGDRRGEGFDGADPRVCRPSDRPDLPNADTHEDQEQHDEGHRQRDGVHVIEWREVVEGDEHGGRQQGAQ